MARGRGIRSPRAAQAAVYSFVETAFMGFPCPKKIVGIRSFIVRSFQDRKWVCLVGPDQVLANRSIQLT